MKEKPKQQPVLSPHLQIYTWETTSVTSALHRITGMISCVTLLALVVIFLFFAIGENAYNIIMDLRSRYWAVTLPAFWALSYHLFNGVRQLFREFGIGFGLKSARISGWLVIVCSFIVPIVIAIERIFEL